MVGIGFGVRGGGGGGNSGLRFINGADDDDLAAPFPDALAFRVKLDGMVGTPMRSFCLKVSNPGVEEELDGPMSV